MRSTEAMTATQQLPASEVLRLALEKLGSNGEDWAQVKGGDYECDDAGHCASTAINSVRGLKTRLAIHYFTIAIGVDASDGELWPIYHWNDAPERTFPEVKAAFERAIALAKAAEGGAR
jgi:hypothetical protein